MLKEDLVINKDARLDMRMNTNQVLDAHFVVNNYDENNLISIFYNYAEVKALLSKLRMLLQKIDQLIPH